MSERAERPLIGCYPGTFDPLTIAHLALAHAAVAQGGLDKIDLVVSRSALGKAEGGRPLLEHRIAVLHAAAATRPWLGVRLTDARLMVDVADGYDVVVMGADKWSQVCDPVWYAEAEVGRDAAVARLLDRVLVAPRAPHPVPDGRGLDVEHRFTLMSSSAVRAGTWEWMAAEARAFDEQTGAWSDPARYDAWLEDG